MRAWILLLLLYVGLVAWYAWHRVEIPPSPVMAWKYIETVRGTETTNAACKKDEDCEPEFACFLSECVLKADRGGTCNPNTGTWALVDRPRTVVCVCKYPHLVTQGREGGDCDVDVACGAHGRLASMMVDPLVRGRCWCDYGYLATRSSDGPACRRQTPAERARATVRPCNSDEADPEYDLTAGFEVGYERAGMRCLKRPCTFDALTGRPLKHAKLEHGVGCWCDPRRGSFGVRLDNAGAYVANAPGYNACVNIFGGDEPERPLYVELYAYFYMRDTEPVVFIHFTGLDDGAYRLAEPFASYVRQGKLQVGQDWPHDPMQSVFRRQEHFTISTRSCWYNERILYTKKCDDREVHPNRMSNCRLITKMVQPKIYDLHMNTYFLLYTFPVCRFDANDVGVSETYRNRYVLNPFTVTFKEEPKLHRSNGLVMFPTRDGTWHVTWAKSPEIEFYLSKTGASVPHLHDAKTDDLKKVVTYPTDIFSESVFMNPPG